MNSSDINSFFFNLIPGTLFITALVIILFLLRYIQNDSFTELQVSWFATSILLLVIALFIGFFFQSVTKLVRKESIDELMAKKVSEKKDNTKFYEIAERLLELYGVGEISFKEKFYFMDNYIRAKNASFNVIHFSSRFSLWANMFWSSLLLLVIMILMSSNVLFPEFRLFLVGMTIFSLGQALMHFESYYDVILKTFSAISQENNNAKNKRYRKKSTN